MSSLPYNKSKVFCFASGQNADQARNHFGSEIKKQFGETKVALKDI